MVLFALYEHASGYAIFRCEGVEDIGSLLPEVQEAVMDFARFGSMLTLEAFSPFKSGVNALENINCISEGLVHEDLKTFLLNNVPQGKKKAAKYVLGVADTKLGAAIQETLEIPCSFGGVVAEMLRGIRLYFHKLVRGLTAPAAAQAQLGLGHSYSRAKVKFNVHRSDNMIIQSISLLDQLDKDINTFSMRIREWYSYHFPELIKIVPDNHLYAKVVKFIGSRKDLTEDKLDELEEMVMDSTKAEAILDAAKMSMGMDISPIDLINIERFATRVIELAQYRKQLSEYLSSKMESVAPNLTTLIGEQVGARLISHAGSLTNLAKYPASTVQILGAEKALFRALKTKGNTPKYGLIFHSSFIGRAESKNKGRISRYLANKCSLASRIDCFSESQTSIFGTKLREQVEERLTYLETGATPRRNIAVMSEALQELGQQQMEVSDVAEETPKKKKKKKKRATLDQGDLDTSATTPAEMLDTDADGKKKKKKKKRETLEQGDLDTSTTTPAEMLDTDADGKKKKKKKRSTLEQGDLDASIPTEDTDDGKKKRKKRKRTLDPDNEAETDISLSKKKKKHSLLSVED